VKSTKKQNDFYFQYIVEDSVVVLKDYDPVYLFLSDRKIY